MNEEELLERLVAGELAAFEQILLAYERRIFSFLARMTGSKEDAKDLTQETFLRLYKHRDQIDPQGNFPSWLFTVAANIARDWFRRQKKAVSLEDVENEEYFETNEDDSPYYLAMASEDKRLIERAIASLKPIYRSAILLYYQDELTYEEIAHTLSLPLNTVKTQIHRAKLALGEHLKKYYE